MDYIFFIQSFFLLLIGHAIADFALQTDIMAKLKNRHNKPDFIPNGQKYVPCWGYWLSAHGLIHAGMVYVVTQNIWLAIIEFIAHCIIDFIKCENKINPHIDQLLHILTKISFIFFII